MRFWGQVTSDSAAADDERNIPAADTVSSGMDPHREAERRDLQRRVRAAVAALGVKERVPLYLIYFEEVFAC